MFSQLLDKTVCAEAVLDHPALKQLHISFTCFLEQKKESRTAKLCIQYSEMIQILRSFIRAERTGDWDLHLRALQDMLPYFASSGRNLYTKSGYVYLMILIIQMFTKLSRVVSMLYVEAKDTWQACQLILLLNKSLCVA